MLINSKLARWDPQRGRQSEILRSELHGIRKSLANDLKQLQILMPGTASNFLAKVAKGFAVRFWSQNKRFANSAGRHGCASFTYNIQQITDVEKP
jgi:hypothetical protein